jgi:hypothetical protein
MKFTKIIMLNEVGHGSYGLNVNGNNPQANSEKPVSYNRRKNIK